LAELFQAATLPAVVRTLKTETQVVRHQDAGKDGSLFVGRKPLQAFQIETVISDREKTSLPVIRRCLIWNITFGGSTRLCLGTALLKRE